MGKGRHESVNSHAVDGTGYTGSPSGTKGVKEVVWTEQEHRGRGTGEDTVKQAKPVNTGQVTGEDINVLSLPLAGFVFDSISVGRQWRTGGAAHRLQSMESPRVLGHDDD